MQHDHRHETWSVLPLIPWNPGYKPEMRGFDATCPRSGWADWLVKGADQLFTNYKIDGLYFDGTSEAWTCENTSHGCGWKDASGNHSVGQLTNHLLFWNERELAKFKGEPERKFNGNNDETFNNFDSKKWNDTVKQFDQVMRELEKLVDSEAYRKARPVGGEDPVDQLFRKELGLGVKDVARVTVGARVSDPGLVARR